MISIRASVAAYEAWLAERLGGDLVAADLDNKHRKMAKSAFVFLRATCFRWAETVPSLCPELSSAPVVDAVGDAHVENFGLWRDDEGRLVWGVNDFDEAARTPYAYDLVRLGASALLARGPAPSAGAIADALIEGYRTGLGRPRPFVLEAEHLWLRDLSVASDDERAAFWEKLRSAAPAVPPPPLEAALVAALPVPTPAGTVFAPRRVGTGSLGRPRFVALAEVRGGPLAREARTLVPSCWSRTDGSGSGFRAAVGPYRAPDPWLRVRDGVVVRRLAPNSRKLDLESRMQALLRLLGAMAHELANIHAADPARGVAVRFDLDRRAPGWLEPLIERAAEATLRDWKAWCG
jgi:hypothetical protein